MAIGDYLKNLVLPERDQAQLLALVAKKTHNAVIITDPKGSIEWVNDGFQQISGYTLEEVKGQKPGDFLQGPATDPETPKTIRQHLDNQAPFTVEILNYTKQHRQYWLELNITPVFNQQGQLTHYIAIELDITQRKQQEQQIEDQLRELQEKNEELRTTEEELRQNAEELTQLNNMLEQQKAELQQSQEQLRKLSLVAEHTDNAVIITDNQGLIEWVNQGFTDLTGYNLEEIQGQKPGHFLQGEETDAATVKRLRDKLKRDEPIEEEILNYTKNGVPYWLNLRISPVTDDAGNVVNYIAVEMDITERRAREEALRDKTQALTDSLNYGRRIQQAVMPDTSRLKKAFNDLMLINTPKDIVSGDFYWFMREGDESLLCVADCTGHGVPGAFMSMLGNSLLNHIVRVEWVHEPFAVLEELDQQLRENLNQDEDQPSNTGLQDGMDLAFVRYNHQTGLLSYAGAMRPLFVTQNGTLQEYKATKRAIGQDNQLGEDQPEFEQHDLQLQTGDRFYLFSDGITDQFGGEQGRKLGKGKVRELLESSLNESMNHQRSQLQRRLDEWRGSLEQTDDILIVGAEVPAPTAPAESAAASATAAASAE
jgi:PAS domain S-box-containing protein